MVTSTTSSQALVPASGDPRCGYSASDVLATLISPPAVGASCVVSFGLLDQLYHACVQKYNERVDSALHEVAAAAASDADEEEYVIVTSHGTESVRHTAVQPAPQKSSKPPALSRKDIQHVVRSSTADLGLEEQPEVLRLCVDELQRCVQRACDSIWDERSTALLRGDAARKKELMKQ